jgi:hypothetical protein
VRALILLACSKCGGMAHYEYDMKHSGNRKMCSVGGEPAGIVCFECNKQAQNNKEVRVKAFASVLPLLPMGPSERV